MSNRTILEEKKRKRVLLTIILVIVVIIILLLNYEKIFDFIFAPQKEVSPLQFNPPPYFVGDFDFEILKSQFFVNLEDLPSFDLPKQIGKENPFE